LAQLRRGAVDVAVLSLGIPPRVNRRNDGKRERTVAPVFEGAAGVEYLWRSLDDFQDVVARASDCAGIARSVAEIEALNAQNKTAILLHLTGAWCNGDLANLHEYYRRGVRAIHLCIEGLPGVGDSSGEVALEDGLTPFGADVVREMNRLGMVVDAAHAADRTAWQILERSTQPVISSHTWCRALRPGARGLPDDLMRAIAASGGVIGLFLVADPVDASRPPRDEKVMAEFRRRIAELWRQYGDRPYEFLAHRYNWDTWKDLPGISNDPGLKPKMRGVETVLAHIDHAVNLVGIDHVGLGPDYEMGVMVPEGLETAAELPNLTAALLEHGYSPDDVKKILGSNFMRVFSEVAAI
jgi:membrane dipeptidase